MAENCRFRDVKDLVLDEAAGFWGKAQFLVDMLEPTCQLIKVLQSDRANLAGVCVCVCAASFAYSSLNE